MKGGKKPNETHGKKRVSRLVYSPLLPCLPLFLFASLTSTILNGQETCVSVGEEDSRNKVGSLPMNGIHAL